MTALKAFLERCEELEPASMLLSRVKRRYSPFMHQQYLYWKSLLEPSVRVFIGDEIGLGKTIEASILLRSLIRRGEKRILILVPKVLRKQWYNELIYFFPDYHVRVLHDGRDIRSELSTKDFPDYRIFLTSIDLAKRKDYDEHFSGDWDVLVVDEAHNLGSDSQRDKLVRKIRAKHVIFLSATPHRGDNDRFLGTMSHVHPVKEIGEARNFLIRRTKRLVDRVRDVLGYPQLFKRCRVCAVVSTSTEEEKRLSRELIEFMRTILKTHADNTAIGLLTAVMRKRVSSSPRAAKKTLSSVIFGTGKNVDKEVLEKILEGSIEELSGALEDLGVEEVDEIVNAYLSSIAINLTNAEKKRLRDFLDLLGRIEEKDSKLAILRKILQHHENEKVIIFTEYKDTLEYLREKLSDLSPLCVYGGMNETEFDKIIEEFRERGRILIATDVASEGLNLQFASILINYEPPWSPVKLEQRIGRIWRLGQKSDVIVYNLFLGTAADREVLEKLYGKVLNISRTFEDVKNILGEEVLGTEIRSIQDIVVPGVSFSEYRAIQAQIRGELDEFVREIVEMIEDIRERTTPIYSEENAYNLAAVYKDLGIISAEEAEEAYKSLRAIARDFHCETVLVPWDKDYTDVEFAGIARVELLDTVVEIPMIIGNSGYYSGSRVLSYLKEALGNCFAPDEVHGLTEPDRITIEGYVRDFLTKIGKPAIRKVDFDVYLRIIRVPISALETSKNYSRSVGQTAEDIVKRIEESNGRIVEERKTLGIYDFYSYDPSEKERPEGMRESERYIEVKGHGLGGLSVALEESEYEFAKKLKDKYWLYIIWNVYQGSPLITCFRDPLSKDFFSVDKKEVEIVVVKTQYVLSMKR